MNSVKRNHFRVLAVAFFLLAPLFGQGTEGYLNFESPQVKPISVARIGGHDYVLACNTPDGSVEVYDTIGMKLIKRVPVGQEPVSVVYSAALSRVYVANMVGDSISSIFVSSDGPSRPLRVQLERTQWVGDEPMMVAVHEPSRTLFVTHNSTSSMSWRDGRTLLPVVPGAAERIYLVDSLTSVKAALKEPRAVAMVGSKLFVLGFRGGHSFFHDQDLWSFDFVTGRLSTLGGLGTQKYAMAAASNGDLWAVGGEAQNFLNGLKAVADVPTGFVTSLLHRVTGAGGQSPKTMTRDLNADSSGKPVKKEMALAHPTDVALMEKGGSVTKVFVAAFHSDRIGVIEPVGSNPAGWTIRKIDVSVARHSTNQMAGPRGLAFKRANPGLPGDPGDRLYALNRLDNSIAVLDPVAEKLLAVVALNNDPTPAHIRAGRRFHYDAKISGHGFVACASCHLDGRTDGLAWKLSAPTSAAPTPLPKDLIDGVTDGRILGMTHFSNDKGPLVTQSMQGLVNWEMRGDAQSFLTNAPYHWRADADFVQSFNGAFVSLFKAKNLAGPGEPLRGLPVAEMKKFEAFTNSLAYPPNPEQPFDRSYSGRFGDPDKTDGTAGKRGLKLFHTLRLAHQTTGVVDPIMAGRSCVQCHFLPEGSNNKITRIGVSTPQPVETTGLRGLMQKESRLETGSQTLSTIVTGEFGLEHQGTLGSINGFNVFVFGHSFPGAEASKLDAITSFVREFDTGTAPLVGFPFSVTSVTAQQPLTDFVLNFFERQARLANVGIAVHAVIGGKSRGFWYSALNGRYHEERGKAVKTRKALLRLAARTGDLLVFQATPLGSERRLASPDGKMDKRSGPAPSSLKLLPMAPNTAHARVPELTRNWVPGTGSNDFHWTGMYRGTNTPVPEPPSLRLLRILQHGLRQDGPSLGLKNLRHEAPRRFRVAGRGIRPGARLVLFVPNDPSGPPPYRSLTKTIPMEIPIFATDDKHGDLPVWESAIEIEPTVLYMLMLGGPSAPGIDKAYGNQLSEPPAKKTFAPGAWNKHLIWVVNEDGKRSDGGWQAVRI